MVSKEFVFGFVFGVKLKQLEEEEEEEEEAAAAATVGFVFRVNLKQLEKEKKMLLLVLFFG